MFAVVGAGNVASHVRVLDRSALKRWKLRDDNERLGGPAQQ
jgi:hypothetical protein